METRQDQRSPSPDELAERALEAAEHWADDIDLTFFGVDLRPGLVYDLVQIFNKLIMDKVLSSGS